MYWQEEPEVPEVTPSDGVVDVLFSLQCRSIPVDHAFALSRSLLQEAPWLEAPEAGIHTIHVAGSQNGWERPTHGAEQHLLLSRRTKLAIRVPTDRVGELLAALEGKTLNIDGAALKIGGGKTKPLLKEPTLFARYVVGPPELESQAGSDEDSFLHWAAEELRHLDIRIKKALCGKQTPLTTPDGPLATRSLLLADLKQEESLRLQRHGLGPNRSMGCGIFIPHKGIEAVHKPK
jgi:CRISPR-associated protein Cas6